MLIEFCLPFDIATRYLNDNSGKCFWQLGFIYRYIYIHAMCWILDWPISFLFTARVTRTKMCSTRFYRSHCAVPFGLWLCVNNTSGQSYSFNRSYTFLSEEASQKHKCVNDFSPWQTFSDLFLNIRLWSKHVNTSLFRHAQLAAECRSLAASHQSFRGMATGEVG